MHFQLSLITLLLVLSAASLATSDLNPASTLCDRGGGATRNETAANVIAFQSSLKGERSDLFKLTEREHECVEGRLAKVESEITDYCDARARAGHDLTIGPLTELDAALTSLQFECDRLRHETDMALMEKTLPETCNELASSIRAFAEVMRTKREPDAEYASCIDANIEQLASPVEKMCESGAISLRPAFFELSERLAKHCKPSS